VYFSWLRGVSTCEYAEPLTGGGGGGGGSGGSAGTGGAAEVGGSGSSSQDAQARLSRDWSPVAAPSQLKQFSCRFYVKIHQDLSEQAPSGASPLRSEAPRRGA